MSDEFRPADDDLEDDDPAVFPNAMTVEQLRTLLADIDGELPVAIADVREHARANEWWGIFRPMIYVEDSFTVDGDDMGGRYLLLISEIPRTCTTCGRHAPDDAPAENYVGWWHEETCSLHVLRAFPRPEGDR